MALVYSTQASNLRCGLDATVTLVMLTHLSEQFESPVFILSSSTTFALGTMIVSVDGFIVCAFVAD